MTVAFGTSFFRRVELAVQQPELRPATAGQKLFQPVELRLHRFRLDFLRLLDQRVDDVGLPPLADLLEKKRPEFIEILRRPPLGHDRLAPRRQFVENGNVEIAVNGHAQRARNRRGRHHENVGILPLAAQRQPLQHAELVLLVDHDETQLVGSIAVVKQRVRAHHDGAGSRRGPSRRFSFQRKQIKLPSLQPVGFFALALRVAGEEIDADAERFEPAAEIERVLLGQDLRRSHQRRLLARLDRAQHRIHRHERLPRPDITLEQPVHRRTLAEIGIDLAHDPPLGVGEGVRKRGQPAAAERPETAGLG
jgi:hypothetical protein